MNKAKKGLTESPEKGSVSADYFHRMLSPRALEIADPFLSEEQEVLEKELQSFKLPKRNFIAIGCGELIHYELSDKYCKSYMGIEPLLDIFLPKPIKHLVSQNNKITLSQTKFGKLDSNELPEGKSLYVFLFNIISYIPQPIQKINKYLKPGDVLFFSTWNSTARAKNLRKKYFDYLNSYEKNVVIDPEETIGLCDLDLFPYHKLSSYKSHKRVKGTITDTLIIYC